MGRLLNQLKTVFKIKNEQGAALILALILLALGSLLLVPLLSFIGFSTKTTSVVYNAKANELYGADAGVRQAMWQIQQNPVWLPTPGNTSSAQNVGTINGKTVSYTITGLNESLYGCKAYRIVSQAIDSISGKSTTITSDMTVLNFSVYTQNAITGKGNIDTKSSDRISGDIQAPSIDGKTNGTLDSNYFTGNISYDPVMGWPVTYVENNPAARYYESQVKEYTPTTNHVITLSSSGNNPPVYAKDPVDPDARFEINGTGSLGGTFFVRGDLDSPNCNQITLNGNTIFVTGYIKFYPGTVIVGPGAIIALGNVDFQPNQDMNEPDPGSKFLYIMSVSGTVNFQPNSSFVGSIAGKTTINLQPGNVISWANPDNVTLNLPGKGNQGIAEIINWKVY
jgi:Tfp pilus assembly protein PilX